MSDTLLVFDFGTTYFKAGVVDRAGNLVALHRQPTPLTATRGRSEMAVKAVDAAIRAAADALRPHLSTVAAISYASQANTFNLVDMDGRGQTPFTVWNDPRGGEIQAELSNFADATFIEASGVPSLNHHFTVGRLAWFNRQRMVPTDLGVVRWLPDWFMFQLTHAQVTEGSFAALSGLFDVPNWRWNESACRLAGICSSQLPQVKYAGDIVGEVLPNAWGVPVGTPVVACSSQWTAGPGIFRGPAANTGQFFHMSFGDVSANLLAHYRNLLPDRPSYESLDGAMTATDRLRLDASAGGEAIKQTITRWATTESRGDVVRAIFRVVAEGLAGHVRRLHAGPERSAGPGDSGGPGDPGRCSALPRRERSFPTEIRSAGGASKSRAWLQLKADVLGIPVIAPATEEPTLLGAASLAANAIGWEALPAINAAPDASRVFRPSTSP